MEGAIKPHAYPLKIKLFGLAVLLATIYSLIILPDYVVAARKLRAARSAYQAQDYQAAINFYNYVLETVPDSKEARIGGAEAIFASGNSSDYGVGLDMLHGITLNKDDWARITKVMPQEYQQYFKDVDQ